MYSAYCGSEDKGGSVQSSIVLSSLLYDSETWTLYRRQIVKLDQFHLRCLRKIAHIRWQDRVPNTEVLSKCRMTGIEAMLIQAQLYAGLDTCCSYARPPHTKNGVLRPVSVTKEPRSSDTKTVWSHTWNYVDSNPKLSPLSSSQNRSSWRHDCKEGIVEFEKARIAAQVEKRYHRKQAVHTTTTTSTNLQNVCNRCSRAVCGSRIGLHSHQRRCRWYTHTWWRDPSIDGSFHDCGSIQQNNDED